MASAEALARPVARTIYHKDHMVNITTLRVCDRAPPPRGYGTKVSTTTISPSLSMCGRTLHTLIEEPGSSRR